MATTSGVETRIDLWLQAIGAEVADLSEVVATWAEESEDNHLNYALEWDELMDRYAVIAGMNSNKRLTPQQQERFRAMRNDLKRALPLVKQLGLSLPPDFQAAR
jgi:hypothetical protein